MKLLLPAIALGILSLAACSTTSNRRDLYRPTEGDGYWTRSLEEGTYKDRDLPAAQLPGPRTEKPKPK